MTPTPAPITTHAVITTHTPQNAIAFAAVWFTATWLIAGLIWLAWKGITGRKHT
jgi:hypothetical protein